MQSYDLRQTPHIVYGAGSLDRLGEMARGKACLVIDPYFQALMPRLRELAEIEVVIDSIAGEPTFDLVNALWREHSLADVEVYIAIGGGSVMDVTKLLSAMTANPDFAANIRDASKIVRRGATWIAVPTTAGTGAEATPNAILLDEVLREKIGIVSPQILAHGVILDAEMTGSVPRALGAATGLDALAHALESYISKKPSPFGDLYALEAMRLVFEYLPAAIEPGNTEARQHMLLASHWAGVCLVARGTCAVHALAYPLSGWFHVPHGASISALLLPVMRLLAPECAARLANAARALRFSSSDDDGVAAASFMDRLDALVTAVGPQKPLSSYGISESDHEKMAASALAIRRLMDLSPCDLSIEQAVTIYASAQP